MPAAVTPQSDGDPLADPPPVLLQPKPKLVIETWSAIGGKVTAIGPDWVEIGAGWRGYLDLLNQNAGGNDKPVRVSTAGTRAGGDPDGFGDQDTYRLTDIKVGDVVSVDAGVTRTKERFCRNIIIMRRPGGTIPPVPTDPFAGKPDLAHLAFHVRFQAEQDWEEKGIPIPRRYLDRDGIWTRTGAPRGRTRRTRRSPRCRGR
jgi:hypothetical protein